MTSSVKVGAPDWQKRHVEAYLRTDGDDGHYLDFSPLGGNPRTPTLLIRTIGRRSGEARLTPLIYGRHGQEVVVIASRGGAPEHPAWYLNLREAPAASFQIADKTYRGPWREATGDERARIWEMMAELNPLYRGYEGVTAREIPVVVFDPREELQAP